jgi:hypothetical protein
MRSILFLFLTILAVSANAQKTTLLIPKKGTETAPAPVT